MKILNPDRMTEKQKRMLSWHKDKLIIKILNLQNQVNQLTK